MYIPKQVILGLLYGLACVVGWLLYGSLSEAASAMPAPAVQPVTPTPTPIATGAGLPDSTHTIVNPGAGASALLLATPMSATGTPAAGPAVVGPERGRPPGWCRRTRPARCRARDTSPRPGAPSR